MLFTSFVHKPRIAKCKLNFKNNKYATLSSSGAGTRARTGGGACRSSTSINGWAGGNHGANKKLTTMYCLSRKRSSKRLIVHAEPKMEEPDLCSPTTPFFRIVPASLLWYANI